MIRQKRRNHYLGGNATPCTNGQVFHRRYREKQAKIMAKVYTLLSDLHSLLYIEKSPRNRVLVDSFGVQNVTRVPSILAGMPVSNGTGIGNMPERAGCCI